MPFDFGGKPVPAPVSGSQARYGVPWVIDTVVPRRLLVTSTRASSCLASASTMIVPSPDDGGLSESADWHPPGFQSRCRKPCKSPARFSRLIGNDKHASGRIADECMFERIDHELSDNETNT